MADTTPPAPLSAGAFLRDAGAAFAALLGLVWLWVLAMPLAFLDPEYPSWLAKQQLLAACDTGGLLILGDSRAAAGVMPTLLPVQATNLAVGGGKAVEALAALDRALQCPTRPQRIVLSLDAVHFTRPDLFWERAARFGFVDAGEIATLRRVSHALGDLSLYEPKDVGGPPPLLRDALYRIGFPALYAGSLLKGGLALRLPRNRRALRAGLAARGHYVFGTADGSGAVAADAHLRGFQPSPVLAWYFDRLLERAETADIGIDFMAIPMNEATARAIDPDVRLAFRAWLATREAKHPGFRVLGDVMPHWPDRYFGDGFAHLNPEGATRFSAGLAACLPTPGLPTPGLSTAGLSTSGLSAACVQRLQAAPPSTQNEAQNGWFNDTGPDASAKVDPSSKRGS